MPAACLDAQHGIFKLTGEHSCLKRGLRVPSYVYWSDAVSPPTFVECESKAAAHEAVMKEIVRGLTRTHPGEITTFVPANKLHEMPSTVAPAPNPMLLDEPMTPPQLSHDADDDIPTRGKPARPRRCLPNTPPVLPAAAPTKVISKKAVKKTAKEEAKRVAALLDANRAQDKRLMLETDAAFSAFVASVQRTAHLVSAASTEELCALMEALHKVHDRFRGAHTEIMQQSNSLEIISDVRELMAKWKCELYSLSRDGGRTSVALLRRLLKSLAQFFGSYGSRWIRAIGGMKMCNSDRRVSMAFLMFWDTTSRDAAEASGYQRTITAKDLRVAMRNRNSK